MSSQSSSLGREHFRYIQERTQVADAFLLELQEAALEAGLPEIWIAPEQASFMQLLLRLGRAHHVVEVGTLAGYSAIWMARALGPGGRLRTLECDPVHAAFARDWIARSDVSERIELTEGDAATILPTLEAASADAFFVDADKEQQPHYLEQALRILRPHGLLMVDNAFAFGRILDRADQDPEVACVRSFNDLLARDLRLQAIMVPLGDGLWVGVKN